MKYWKKKLYIGVNVLIKTLIEIFTLFVYTKRGKENLKQLEVIKTIRECCQHYWKAIQVMMYSIVLKVPSNILGIFEGHSCNMNIANGFSEDTAKI